MPCPCIAHASREVESTLGFRAFLLLIRPALRTVPSHPAQRPQRCSRWYTLLAAALPPLAGCSLPFGIQTLCVFLAKQQSAPLFGDSMGHKDARRSASRRVAARRRGVVEWGGAAHEMRLSGTQRGCRASRGASGPSPRFKGRGLSFRGQRYVFHGRRDRRRPWRYMGQSAGRGRTVMFEFFALEKNDLRWGKSELMAIRK